MSYLSRNGAILNLEHFMTSDSDPGSFLFDGESYKYTLSRNVVSSGAGPIGNIFNAMDDNLDTFSGGVSPGYGANIIPFSITFDKPLTLMNIAYKILINRAANWYTGPFYNLQYNNGTDWVTLLDSSLPETGKIFELTYADSPNFINNVYGIRIRITTGGAYTSLYDIKFGLVSSEYKSVFDLPLITNNGTILDDNNCVINSQKKIQGAIVEPDIAGDFTNYINSGIQLNDVAISKKTDRTLNALNLDELLLLGNKSDNANIKSAVILQELLSSNKINRTFKGVLLDDFIMDRFPIIKSGYLADSLLCGKRNRLRTGPLIDSILCGKRNRLRTGYILEETVASNHEKKYGYVFIM